MIYADFHRFSGSELLHRRGVLALSGVVLPQFDWFYASRRIANAALTTDRQGT
jgi:hypothetical protein